MTPTFDALPKRIQDAISALELETVTWEEAQTLPDGGLKASYLNDLEQAREDLAKEIVMFAKSC